MPDINKNADLMARQIRTRSTKLGSDEPEDTVTATGAEMLRVAEVIEAQAAEISRLRDALTPSASTKAAYMGEFTIAVERHVNEDDEPYDEGEGAPDPYEHIQVPWTTIKEVMAAIRAYAALQDGEAGNGE